MYGRVASVIISFSSHAKAKEEKSSIPKGMMLQQSLAADCLMNVGFNWSRRDQYVPGRTVSRLIPTAAAACCAWTPGASAALLETVRRIVAFDLWLRIVMV